MANVSAIKANCQTFYKLFLINDEESLQPDWYQFLF